MHPTAGNLRTPAKPADSRSSPIVKFSLCISAASQLPTVQSLLLQCYVIETCYWCLVDFYDTFSGIYLGSVLDIQTLRTREFISPGPTYKPGRCVVYLYARHSGGRDKRIPYKLDS